MSDFLRALRPRLSYANVMATVAVFLAAGGGAYGALHSSGRVFHGCVDQRTGVLRVLSTGQACRRPRTINQNGRPVQVPGEHAITWNQTGPAGPTGAPGQPGTSGPQGVQGTQGVQGPAGPFPTTLPSGKTLTGVYRSEVVMGVTKPDTETFAYPLAFAPTAHFVGLGTMAPPECPGSTSDPQAAPGNLCLYAALGEMGANVIEISDPNTNLSGSSPRGFSVEGGISSGSWAVTAP